MRIFSESLKCGRDSQQKLKKDMIKYDLLFVCSCRELLIVVGCEVVSRLLWRKRRRKARRERGTLNKCARGGSSS